MHIYAKQLRGMPVMSLQAGLIEATIVAPLLKVQNLAVVGFLCETAPTRKCVLRVEDIRGLASDALIINDTDDLSEPDDLVRLIPIIRTAYSPLKQSVVTDTGRKLGSVKDYTIDTHTLLVDQLIVRPPILQSVPSSNRIVHRNQIIDISSKAIIVRDTTNPLPITSQNTAPNM